MRFPFLASSILGCALFLTGCQSLGLRDYTAHDQVPPAVKAEPRIVDAPSLPPDQPWPRLGDVPFMPKDFSPKPVYDHYLNEMEFQRAEGEEAKKKALENAPAAPDSLSGSEAPLLSPQIQPPQFQPTKE